MSEPAPSDPTVTGLFYVGLFGGILGTYVGLLGVIETGLLRVALGSIVGIALGWALGTAGAMLRGR